jgi:cell division protein FtsI/penicillin-binding protein 2
MAQFYTALATGKPPIVPHIARSEGLADRRATWELGLSELQRSQLVEALRAVVNHPDGTAYPYRSDRWEMAGKTGTDQVSQAVPFAIRVVERYLDTLHPELLEPPPLADVPEGPLVSEEEAR